MWCNHYTVGGHHSIIRVTNFTDQLYQILLDVYMPITYIVT